MHKLTFVFRGTPMKRNSDIFCMFQVIRRNAGEIDDNFSKRCTHFLCLHQQGDDYKKVRLRLLLHFSD